MTNHLMTAALDSSTRWDNGVLANYGYTPTDAEVEATARSAIASGLVDLNKPAGQMLHNRGAAGMNSPAIMEHVLEAAVEAGVVRRIVAWLRDLYEPHQVIEITGIKASGGRFSVFGRLGEPAELDRIEQFLSAHWGWANLYYGVNPRLETKLGSSAPATKDDVASRHLVVFDHDDGPADASVRIEWEQQMLAKHPRKHVVAAVRSGNGLQVLLHVQEEIGTELVRSRGSRLQAMYQAAGADSQVHNADRVFRLPYTLNIPNKSKRAKGRVIAVTGVMEIAND